MLPGLVTEVPLVTGELMMCLTVGEGQDEAATHFRLGVKYICRLQQLLSKSPCL